MASVRLAERSAYRALLRVCREGDRQPHALLPLLGRPPRRYDGKQRKALRMQVPGSPFAEDMIFEACGWSTEFANPVPGGAARAARRHYLRALKVGLDYEVEARHLHRRFQEAQRIAAEVGTLPLATTQARLLKSFSPTNGDVVVGDLLLSHPLSCVSEPVFDQTAILIDSFQAGAEPGAERLTGVVLNKPTGITLGQLFQKPQDSSDEELAQHILPALASVKVFRAGPIISPGSLQTNLRCLHGFGDVKGAVEVVPGAWMGGDLVEVAKRAASMESCYELPLRMFLGHAVWTSLQLAIELESGVWVRTTGLPEEANGHHPMARLCFSMEERSKGWRAMLQTAGLTDLAQFPRAPGTDRRLRGHIDRQQRAVEGDTDGVSEGAGRSSGRRKHGSR